MSGEAFQTLKFYWLSSRIEVGDELSSITVSPPFPLGVTLDKPNNLLLVGPTPILPSGLSFVLQEIDFRKPEPNWSVPIRNYSEPATNTNKHKNYKTLNQCLLLNALSHLQDHKKWIISLSKAIWQNAVPQDIPNEVYRWTVMDPREIDLYVKDKVFFSLQFLSCSKTKEKPHWLNIPKWMPNGQICKFKITIPDDLKGRGMMYIAPYSVLPEEEEVLFICGSKFKIVANVEKECTEITLEYLGIPIGNNGRYELQNEDKSIDTNYGHLIILFASFLFVGYLFNKK